MRVVVQTIASTLVAGATPMPRQILLALLLCLWTTTLLAQLSPDPMEGTSRTLTGFAGPVELAVSPDGKVIAVGAGRSVKVLNASTGKIERNLGEHSRRLQDIAFSPDGKTLASGDGEFQDGQLAGEIRLWDIATGELKRTLTWSDSDIASFCFSPDGKRIAGGGAKGLRVWDLQNGKLTHDEAILGGAISVAFSPDGQTLAHGGFDEVVNLRDAKTWEVKKVLKRHRTEVRAISFSSDGKIVASGGGGELQLWDVKSGGLIRNIRRPSTVWSIVFTPDGKSVATGSGDPSEKVPGGTILWDVASGELQRRWTGNNGGVVSVAISPDGKSIVSGSDGGTLEMRRLNSPSSEAANEE